MDDCEMEMCDDEGIPTVDDIRLVAEHAEAELRQLEKIEAAAERAKEIRKQKGKQQKERGAADGAGTDNDKQSKCPEGKKVGGAMRGDSDSSEDDAPSGADEAAQNCDSAPESESGETIEKLEDFLKEMQARPIEPESPDGPLHGLDLADLSEEQLHVEIKDTDKLTHIGRVASVVDGIIVVKALENSCPLDTGSLLCSECRKVIGLVEDIFGQVTQPSYAVRPCGDSIREMPSVNSKVMAVTSRMVRVDLGTARNAPAIDFEEGIEDPEDLDTEDLEDSSQKKAREGVIEEAGDASKITKAKAKGRGMKPMGTFQGVAGVDNAEDALKALGTTGKDRASGPGRGRGRAGTGMGGRGRAGVGGRGRGRHGSGRNRQHKASPAEAPAAGHGMQMQPNPALFTAPGPMAPPHAQIMPVMAGVQPGMPMMMMPHGYVPAGGAPAAVGMGFPHAPMHMHPTGVGPRPPFVACPPVRPPVGIPVAPPGGVALGAPGGALAGHPPIPESFEQKLARALGPPPA